MAHLNLTKEEMQFMYCVLWRSCGYSELDTKDQKSTAIKKLRSALVKIADKRKKEYVLCNSCQCPLELIDGGSYQLCACCGAPQR